MAKDYPCQQCTHVATCDKDLVQHDRRSHAPPDKQFYECSTCQKLYTSMSILKQHEITHSPEAALICLKEGCIFQGRGFGSKNNFKRHLHTHDPTKRVSCDTCGKKLSRGDSLKRHCKMSRNCKLKTKSSSLLATTQQASAPTGNVDVTPHNRQTRSHAHSASRREEGCPPVTTPSEPVAGPSRLADIPGGTFSSRRQAEGSGHRYHPYPSRTSTTGYVQAANAHDPNGNPCVARLVPLFGIIPPVLPVLSQGSFPPPHAGHYPNAELPAFGGRGTSATPMQAPYIFWPYSRDSSEAPRLHGITGDFSASELSSEVPRFISPGSSNGHFEGPAGVDHFGRSNSLTPNDSFSSVDTVDTPSTTLASIPYHPHAMRQLGELSSDFLPAEGPSGAASSASVLSQDQGPSVGHVDRTLYSMSFELPGPPVPLARWSPSQSQWAMPGPQSSQVSEGSEFERQFWDFQETSPVRTNDPFMYDDDLVETGVVLASFGPLGTDSESKADAEDAGL